MLHGCTWHVGFFALACQWTQARCVKGVGVECCASSRGTNIAQSHAMPTVTVKWTSKELEVELADAATVSDLKHKLQEETHVNPKRQKLLGLKRKDGKPAGDDDVLLELGLKPGTKVILMGCVAWDPVGGRCTCSTACEVFLRGECAVCVIWPHGPNRVEKEPQQVQANH